MKLIDNARQWYKFWSIQLSSAGVFLLGVILAAPDAALQAWLILPAEFKAVIPTNYLLWIVLAIFILSIIARSIKQRKLHRGDES